MKYEDTYVWLECFFCKLNTGVDLDFVELENLWQDVFVLDVVVLKCQSVLCLRKREKKKRILTEKKL
jgi:hypothetical protein